MCSCFAILDKNDCKMYLFVSPSCTFKILLKKAFYLYYLFIKSTLPPPFKQLTVNSYLACPNNNNKNNNKLTLKPILIILTILLTSDFFNNRLSLSY